MFEMTGDITGKFKTISSVAHGCNKELEVMLSHVSKLEKRYAALSKQTEQAARQFQSLKDHMGNVCRAVTAAGSKKPPPGGRQWRL